MACDEISETELQVLFLNFLDFSNCFFYLNVVTRSKYSKKQLLSRDPGVNKPWLMTWERHGHKQKFNESCLFDLIFYNWIQKNLKCILFFSLDIRKTHTVLENLAKKKKGWVCDNKTKLEMMFLLNNTIRNSLFVWRCTKELNTMSKLIAIIHIPIKDP